MNTAAQATPERLLKISDVSRKIGMGKSWIYDRIETGAFPKPVRISPGAVRWRESEVDSWIAALDHAS